MQLTKKGKSDFPLIHDGPSFLKKNDVFFHAGSESVWGRVKFRRIETVATTVEKQQRLNFSRNPFNSPRRGELIGTPEPGININDLVVT